MSIHTLPEALDAQLREDRELIFVNGEGDLRRMPFARLRPRALGALAALQARGAERGQRVILHLNDNEAFIVAFWACLLGGLVAVPVAVGNSDAHRAKLFTIRRQMPGAWLVTEAATLSRLERYAGESGLSEAFASLQAVTLSGDVLVGGEPARARTAAVRAEDVAFIQYSSGSTSTPKGVVLTHRNLLTNIEGITAATGLNESDVALSWMPLTHDMGLIGFHLHMLARGISHAIMRTDLFARRPLLWLHMASELQASVLCSPNFGYQHALRQYASKGAGADWDLSRVRFIFNGAEPISAPLAQRFMETMAAHGLPPNAMFPVYGLAEASLAVSFPEPEAPMQVVCMRRDALRIGAAAERCADNDEQALPLVKLGRAIPGTELRIVDDDGTPLAQGSVGHVQIRGGNVTTGYLDDAEANATAFSADGWLYTGDVGFLSDDDGQLVLTGRSKDIIFVNGQNYYPHDLETLAEEVPGIDTNKVAVIGARLGEALEEQVVALVLHRGSIEDFVPTARAVRRLLNQQTGLEIARVYPVSRMPKTTSGKLQRHALKAAVEAGDFAELDAELVQHMPELVAATDAEQVAEPPAGPPADTREALLRICTQVLPDKQIALDTDLFEINIDSMKLARLHEAIDVLYPDRLDVTDLFDYPTLNDLADFLDRTETA